MFDFAITGSRVYGPHREDSDIDIVVRYWDLIRTIIPLLESLRIEYAKQSEINPGYKGIKFKLHENLPEIQIICALNSKELEAWRQATKSMCDLPPIENRKERIATFSKLYEFHFKV